MRTSKAREDQGSGAFAAARRGDAGGERPPPAAPADAAPTPLQLTMRMRPSEAWALAGADDEAHGLCVRLGTASVELGRRGGGELTASVELGGVHAATGAIGRGKGAPPLDPLLAPLDVRLSANRGAEEAAALVASVGVPPVSVSVNPSQLRLLADVKAALPPPRRATTPKAVAAAAPAEAAAAVGGRPMELALSIASADATLYGGRFRSHPVASVRLGVTTLKAEQLATGGVARHARFSTSFEALVRSAASGAWEPIVALATVEADVQQRRDGLKSVHVQLGDLEVTLTDAMLTSLLAARAAAARALAAPSVTVALAAEGAHAHALQIRNECGAPLRVVLRGEAEPRELAPGETAALSVDDAPGRGQAVEELAVQSDAGWHALPPFPSGRCGSWTLLAGAAGRRRGSVFRHQSISEPLAVQCSVRALADGADGVALTVRSLIRLHNSTSQPLALQLVVPPPTDDDAPAESLEVVAEDGAPPPPPPPPPPDAAAGTAAEAASERIDLGVLQPGESAFVPPHLSTAHLRARPAAGASGWPSLDEAYWLGDCSQTRRQARELQRVRKVFGLRAEERVLNSWACALAASESGGARLMIGRLYLTSSSLCFLSTMLGREVRRLVDVKEITSMHKTQVASIKGAAISINTTSSAASGAAALQLCSFANRNRAFASLQRHLTASLPHLAARWQTPSSATLQRQFGLPASELPLHEFPCSCDGPERSHRGTLYLTTNQLCFVSMSGSHAWHVAYADVLKLRAGGANGAARELQLSTRSSETALRMKCDLAEVLEAFEGLLPEGAIGDAAPAGAAADDDDDADGAWSGGGDGDDGALHPMRAPPAATSFVVCVGVRSRPAPLHGRAGSAPPLQESVVTFVAPLRLHNTLPYALQFALHAADVPPGAATGEVAAGATATLCELPLAATSQLRLRIAAEWSAAVAELSGGGWSGGRAAARLVSTDTLGRPAQLSVAQRTVGPSRDVLQLTATAELWLFNRSALPLHYQLKRRFGAEAVRARRRSTLRRKEGGGRKMSTLRAVRSAAGTAAKAAAAEGKARVAATRAGGAAVALASKLPFGRKKQGSDAPAPAGAAATPSGEAAPIWMPGDPPPPPPPPPEEDDEDDEGEGEGEDGSESSGEEDSGDDGGGAPAGRASHRRRRRGRLPAAAVGPAAGGGGGRGPV